MMRKMKDSGIEWIGEIPCDWSVKKCKYFTKFINGFPFDSEDLRDDYVYPVVRISDIHDGIVSFKECLGVQKNIGLNNYQIQKDDILLAMSGATVGKAGFAEHECNGYINQRVGIIRTKEPKFLFYCLTTKQFIEYVLLISAGTAQPNVSTKGFGEFTVPFPPLEEQKKIADFLDKQCGEIDAIKADVERQIELLTDYKKSIITEAVTKGLNPKAKMKDSGIEWVGEIPEHWEVIKAKYLFKQRNTKGNSVCLQLLSPSQKFGVIPQSKLEELTTQKVVKLKENINLADLKTIRKGDFCISLRSFQGGFEYSDYEGVVSPAYQVFYSIVPNHNGYHKYLFKERSFIEKMNSFTMSLRDGKNIAFDDFANSEMPVPPLSEQQAIADYLDEKCSEIDAAIADKQKQLTTLDEYKKSLIFEYVTGKKEVV